MHLINDTVSNELNIMIAVLTEKFNERDLTINTDIDPNDIADTESEFDFDIETLVDTDTEFEFESDTESIIDMETLAESYIKATQSDAFYNFYVTLFCINMSLCAIAIAYLSF